MDRTRAGSLRAALAIVVAVATLAAAGSAHAATVTRTGGQISIDFTATGSTPENVYVHTVGSNWSISGDITGTNPYVTPISSACDIIASASGNSTAQTLQFAPAATIASPDCNYGPFKLRVLPGSGIDKVELSAIINVQQSGSVIDINAPAQLIADFAAHLYTTDSISFNGGITGAHALALDAGSIYLANGVGTDTALTSVATTGLTTLYGNVTTSGTQTYTGSVLLATASSTLTASALTLGGTSSDSIAPDQMNVTLTASVSEDSTINGVLGNNGSTSISLVKAGSGKLSLPAPNTYTGSTTVNAGTLDCANSSSLGASSGAFTENLGGSVVLQSGAQTFDVGTGAVLNFSGGVNGASTGRGTVTATGTGIVSVGSSGIGGTTPIDAFASSATGGLRIGGDVHAAGAVTLAGAVETRSSTSTVTGAPVSGSGTIDNGNGAAGSTLTIDSGTEPNTLSGAIGSGAGDATKLSLVLTGGSAHTLSAATSGLTGSLTVQAGGLIVGGTLTHPSSTTIASGATVSGFGSGTIGSAVSLASGSAGFGIGAGYAYRLTTGSLTSSTVVGYLNVVVDGTAPGTGYTQIVSTGSANLAGLNVWSDGFEAPIGTVITPVTTATGITGTLAGKPEGSYYGYWQISYAANGGKDMTWTFVGDAPNPTAVSPSTSAPAGGGTLTVTGAPLYDGTTVTVGGAACTNATRISISELTCTLPAHAVGAADVVVTNGTRSATLTGAVTYTVPADPAVTAASASGGGTTTRTLAIGTPRLVGTKLVTTITAPGAGAVRQTAVTRKGRKATTYCTVRRPVAAAADLTITCALNARARAALRRSSLRLTVTTTFTPTGGAPTTRVAKVKAKRATTGKRTLLL